MQSNPKNLYSLTSKRTGKPEQLYKDLGNFVFSKLNKELKRPKTLIIKLRGIGQWYLRKKRMEIALTKLPADYIKTREDYSSETSFQENENKKELHKIFQERLEDYKEFLDLKQEIRKERFKTQTKIVKNDNKYE